ncbi:hypothetical protein BDF20DRAFT_832937 [Mycotypha africana]|uniref:uncharacterized protein n=1 Tax=Mycotypha africana TaxID=64632 RepID=UPI002300C933|nr:uncharacterized protein BDF20DRAFT_832937 [Mycotypha africana]KAI8988055.1 hypothetical protein BDF20DRAFT_832937 [Mycotypha africana]
MILKFTFPKICYTIRCVYNRCSGQYWTKISEAVRSHTGNTYQSFNKVLRLLEILMEYKGFVSTEASTVDPSSIPLSIALYRLSVRDLGPVCFLPPVVFAVTGIILTMLPIVVTARERVVRNEIFLDALQVAAVHNILRIQAISLTSVPALPKRFSSLALFHLNV